jgi:hypothetical protein
MLVKYNGFGKKRPDVCYKIFYLSRNILLLKHIKKKLLFGIMFAKYNLEKPKV